ncbi:MAG TPA: hypothetical protein VLN59_00775 [Burkholderiales bacterium]|nr:hypothetical protein [Burkholderiales bacterium]
MPKSDIVSTRPFDSSHTQSAEHLDRALDQAIEDSFPTSDPVSLTMPHRRPAPAISVSSALPLLIIGGIVLALLLRRAGA